MDIGSRNTLDNLLKTRQNIFFLFNIYNFKNFVLKKGKCVFSNHLKKFLFSIAEQKFLKTPLFNLYKFDPLILVAFLSPKPKKVL